MEGEEEGEERVEGDGLTLGATVVAIETVVVVVKRSRVGLLQR